MVSAGVARLVPLVVALCLMSRADEALVNTGKRIGPPPGSKLFGGSLTSLDYGAKLAVGDFAANRVSVYKQDEDGNWLQTPELQLQLEAQGLTSLAALEDDTLLVGVANNVQVHPLDPEAGYHSTAAEVISGSEDSEFFGSSIAVLPNNTLAVADWGKQLVSLYRRVHNNENNKTQFELVQSVGVPGKEFGSSLAVLPLGGLAVGDAQGAKLYIFNGSSPLPLESTPSSVIQGPSNSVLFSKSMSYANGVLIVGDPAPEVKNLGAYALNKTTSEYLLESASNTEIQPYAICAVGQEYVAVGDFKAQRVALWRVSSNSSKQPAELISDELIQYSDELLDDSQELLI